MRLYNGLHLFSKQKSSTPVATSAIKVVSHWVMINESMLVGTTIKYSLR